MISYYVPSALAAAVLVWVTWKFTSFVKPREQHSLRSVAIVVLGDIGRSPRMMYHAESFADNGFFTDLIGYGGSKPIPSLEQHSRVRFNYLPEPPHWLRFLPFLVSGPIKVGFQIHAIFAELFRIPNPPEFILVQNPPSIPTLAVVWAVSRMRGSKIIVDWHNLGYSILALRFKQRERHPLVRIAKWFEKTFGRTAYAHLFVTEAMRDFLVKEWDLQGRKVVLHDRPPRRFRQTTPQETHDLFAFKLRSKLYPIEDFLPSSDPPHSTPLTTTDVSKTTTMSAGSPTSTIIDPIYSGVKAPRLREDRPALLVSSTSWTPDEDFSILITALGQYDARARAAAPGSTLPKVLVILTGKGPLRDRYMTEVRELQREWKWVRCVNMWLEAEDYPVLLGSADLGICLHTSSSKLDLPMKVVDMFGCSLPVCALNFECLHELVKDGKNGLVFENASQLAQQIETLLTGFPNCPRLSELRSYLLPATDRAMSPRQNPDSPEPSEDVWEPWDDNWTHYVRPLILKDVQRES